MAVVNICDLSTPVGDGTENDPASLGFPAQQQKGDNSKFKFKTT